MDMVQRMDDSLHEVLGQQHLISDTLEPHCLDSQLPLDPSSVHSESRKGQFCDTDRC